MLVKNNLPEHLQNAVSRIAQNKLVSNERAWITVFQTYLYRITQQPRIVVASFDRDSGDWKAHTIEFQVNLSFVDALKKVTSLFMGEFPVQAYFLFGTEPFSRHDGYNLIVRLSSSDMEWEFDNDVYSEKEAKNIASNFLIYLENLIDNLNGPCAKISLLTKEKLHQQAVNWNRTEAPFDSNALLDHLFGEMARKYPEAVAVRYGNETLTYGELDLRSSSLSQYMVETGVSTGSLVGLFFERGVDLVVSMLAVLKAGAAFVPFDPRYPLDALNRILDNLELSFLVTNSNNLEKFPQSVKNTVLIDKIILKKMRSPVSDNSNRQSESLSFVLFTSGSTGIPKGVMHTHKNIVARFFAIQQFLSMGMGDAFSQSSPISSIDAIDELLFPLLHGATTVIIPYETVIDPYLLLEAMKLGQITHILLVPSLLRVILDALDKNPEALKELKVCIVGGEALSKALAENYLQKLPHSSLCNFYGLTEGDVSRIEVTPEVIQKYPSSIGRPVSNTKVYLLDEFDNLVQPGTPGEICVSGEALFLGYLNRPDLNEKVFLNNPFLPSGPYSKLFRTGDFGIYLPDGNLEYLGRRDRMIKIRGFRVELGEIENVLRKYPGILECLVTVRESQHEDGASPKRNIVAYFIPEAGLQLITKSIQKHLEENLPDFSIPHSIIQVDQFPLLPNGKVDVKSLPNPTEIFRQESEHQILPRNPTEERLKEIWETLLQIRPIGINENFFDLGGDSLSAIDLVLSLEKSFGQSLPISILLQYPTIGELATILNSSLEAKPMTSLVPIQPLGDLPPLFCIHADGGVMFYYEFARRMNKNRPIYGLQARGLSAGDRPHASVEKMASDYIAEIKTVQPIGPYHFCAFSLGGVVALEMARQLRKEGEIVKFVGLLDAYAPGYPQLLPEKNIVQYKMSVHVGTLRLHDWRGKLNYLLRRIKTRLKKIITTIFASLLLTLKIPLPQSIRYYYVANHLNALVDNHQPQICSGTVTLFKASVQPENIVPDPHLGWSKYVAEEIKLIDVTGTHNSIIKEPHLSMLVEAIESELSL